MDDLLIFISPALFLVILWVTLAKLRKARLRTSTHFGFAITLCVLTTYGLWALDNLGRGKFSGLILFFGWMYYWIPVAAVTYLLVISCFTISRSWLLWRHKKIKEAANK